MNKSNLALGLKSLKVNYAGRRVGILAMTPNGRKSFIDGNGKNPTDKNLLNVGLRAGMPKSRCCEIMEQIRTIVFSDS